jgi:aspartyl-tRNA(Asn)/glutamyl-tRNA(Gln) amidotransferase subunit C
MWESFRREFPLFPRRAISSLLPGLMSADFDVRYTAQLARLQLGEEEIAMFQKQLSQVLEHVEKLKQVDVSGVEPTAHANAVFNVFREDATRDWFSAAEALSNAPRQANQLFIVPKVIE